jgi:hypothetical protein
MRILPILFVALGLFAALPVSAEVRILGSPGGEVGPFVQLFEVVRQSGERVVIDGPCFSACTLVLSMVPRSRICVTRRAVLGFHGARSVDRLAASGPSRRHRNSCWRPIRRRSASGFSAGAG